MINLPSHALVAKIFSLNHKKLHKRACYYPGLYNKARCWMSIVTSAILPRSCENDTFMPLAVPKEFTRHPNVRPIPQMSLPAH